MNLLTIRSKYVLLACGTAVATALLVGGYNYRWIERLTLERATVRLEDEAGLVGRLVRDGFERLRQDALVIAGTPPFRGLARSEQAGGRDALDRSTSTQWRSRLQAIFASLMAARPSYVQMRYIGMADGGRELVRTDLRDGVLRDIPESELQRKGDRPYVRESLDLQPGEVRFSAAEFNVDHGTTEYDLPVIRATTPIHDEAGRLFGLLVINVHYGKLLEAALAGATTPFEIYLVDEAGNFIVRGRDGSVSQAYLQGHQEQAAFPARHASVLAALTDIDQNSITTSRTVDGEELILSRSRVPLQVGDGERYIDAILATPREAAMADAYDTRHWAIIVSVAAVLVAAFVAALAAGLVTRPLWTAVTAVRRYQPGQTEVGLPVDRADEIGEFSRAFEALVARLEDTHGAERLSRARLQAVTDHSIDGLMTIDDTGTVTAFNPAAARIFGYAPEEIVGRNVNLLMPEPFHSEHDGYLGRYRETGKRRFVGKLREVEGRTRDGRSVPIEITVSEVTANGETLFSGVLRDISKRKRMEQELHQQREVLERADRMISLGGIVAGVAHELNTPIGSALTVASTLTDQVERLTTEVDSGQVRRSTLNAGLGELGDGMSMVVRGLERASELIQHFKQVAVDQTSERRRLFAVGDLVNDVTSSLRPQFKHCAVALTVDAASHSQIDSYPGPLGQVLINLVANAQFHGFDKEQPGTVSVAATDLPSGDVEIAVRDDGKGIPPELINRVFDPFMTTRLGDGGSGLGLSIAHNIVTNVLGGEIRIESEPGAGTAAILRIPAIAPDTMGSLSETVYDMEG